MQNSRTSARLAGIAAALVLIVFGLAAVAKGVDGHSTVHDSLRWKPSRVKRA